MRMFFHAQKGVPITYFSVETIKTMLYDKYCCEKDK